MSIKPERSRFTVPLRKHSYIDVQELLEDIECRYILSNRGTLNGGIHRAISSVRRSAQAIFQRNSESDKFLNEAALSFDLKNQFF